jgi:hypothetical protein
MIDLQNLFIIASSRDIAVSKKIPELSQINQIALSRIRGEISLDGQVRFEISHGLFHIHSASSLF